MFSMTPFEDRLRELKWFKFFDELELCMISY